MQPKPTARLMANPNEHGVYTCPPDLVARWKAGRSHIKAELLELEGGVWIYRVDSMIGNEGRSGPLTRSVRDGDLDTALEGVVRDVGKAIQSAEDHGFKGAAVKRLRVWADGLPDLGNWHVPEEGDGLQPKGLISPRGRKPMPPLELERIPENPAEDDRIRSQMQLAADVEKEEIYAAGEVIGRIQSMEFIATIANSTLLDFFEIAKKSKAWKLMKNRQNCNYCNFDEFCEERLGKGYRRLQDLSVTRRKLGQEAFEQAEKIGLRQVDYNALKALPAPKQELIREALEEGADLAAVQRALRKLAADDQKEIETLETRLNDALGDKTAAEAVSKKNADKAQELEHELEKFKFGADMELKHKIKWSEGFGKLLKDVDGLDLTMKEGLASLEAIRLGVTQMAVPEDEAEIFLQGRKHLAARMRETIQRVKENADALECCWNNTLGAMTDEETPQEWEAGTEGA